MHMRCGTPMPAFCTRQAADLNCVAKLRVLFVVLIAHLVSVLSCEPVHSSNKTPHVMAPLSVEQQPVLVGEDIIKPRCDKLGYRSVTLPNGLRVLLISDPDTDKAAAALNVSVGTRLQTPASFLQSAMFESGHCLYKYPIIASRHRKHAGLLVHSMLCLCLDLPTRQFPC